MPKKNKEDNKNMFKGDPEIRRKAAKTTAKSANPFGAVLLAGEEMDRVTKRKKKK